MTGQNILGIVNAVLRKEILDVTIRVVTLISGPQPTQIDGRMLAAPQGTRRPLVFAVGNNTALECTCQITIEIGVNKNIQGQDHRIRDRQFR
jgi:hypothetical protein